ncbi:hypothetical protein [Novosphingobium sp. 11B]
MAQPDMNGAPSLSQQTNDFLAGIPLRRHDALSATGMERRTHHPAILEMNVAGHRKRSFLPAATIRLIQRH